MSLNMIKMAIDENKYSPNQKKIIKTIEESVGKKKAKLIIESFQVTPDDYSKWLEVVIGYADDEGINISRKKDFQDVAGAVLENDPQPIDFDMQTAIINTLWANFKARQQHSKVQKVVRAKEEEEQLKFALKKMSGRENEERGSRIPSEGACGGRRSQEDEQQSEFQQAYSRAFQDEEFDDEFDPRGEDFPKGRERNDWDDMNDGEYDDFDDGEEDLEPELPFDDQEQQDDQIMQRGSQMQKSKDLEDFDPASHQRSRPKAYYAAESEEQTAYSSPFSKGQLVTCKKDNKQYKIEIEDGPADMVGIMVNGRIKMVPSKDLEVPHAKEDEESTNKQPQTISFLHDVLHGTNSTANLKKLQDEVETAGANAWTLHHAKMPKNPHAKGSIAFKSWQRGMEKAAKEIWAPRVVEQPNKKPVPKKKK